MESSVTLGKIIEDGTAKLNIEMPTNAIEAFGVYFAFLEEKSKEINLTSITGVEDVAQLHFLDSLAMLMVDSFDGKRVIDVGSGAGFPGLPIKIVIPTMELTLLDATAKKVDFLRALSSELGLETNCIHERAEEASQKEQFRGKFDIAISRAVARLNVLCELCLPFVCIGGMFYGMKGIDSNDEIEEAQNAIVALGGKIESIVDYAIPETDIHHRIIGIKKTASTPDAYPRRFARISKSPL
ncbi:MAG: 16S rRNA (guanine(527)-N(7))-methyltransferase RsmG [Oscillospiraceae bacterium]|nr:16S rRNA (guanine(527)-N(7))-methyltransferase RsmG [Oscillospiraceae bacterium]